MKYTEVQQMRKQAAEPISTPLWGGQAIHDAWRSGVMRPVPNSPQQEPEPAQAQPAATPESMQTSVPEPDGKASNLQTPGEKQGLMVDDKPRTGYPAGQTQPDELSFIDRLRANWNRVFTKGPFGLPAQRMMPKGMSDNMKDGRLKNFIRNLENTTVTWM